MIASDVIGIAGCGAMGLPMAERLLAAGYAVWGFDVKKIDKKSSMTRRMVDDPNEFARKCDIVFSVVRDQQQTLDLCFQKQALFSDDIGADCPQIFIICSTVSPNFVKKLDKILPKRMTLLDAPMSGAPYRAAEGTLTFMVGGDDGAVERLMPLFRCMGQEIHHLGPIGTGMTCKVVNNFVALTGVVAVRKALASARALGLDRRRLLDVMRTSSGATWYGDHLDDINWAREGYNSANTIGILEKDLMSYLDAAPGGADDFEDALLNELRRLEPLDDF